MAYTVDAAAAFRVQPRSKKTKRSDTNGLSFMAGAAIATVGAVAAFGAIATIGPFHGPSATDRNPPRLALAAIPPAPASKQADQRLIRSQKSARLYPYAADDVVTHVAKAYQVPPRQAVASVNVSVMPAKKELFAFADVKSAPAEDKEPLKVASIPVPEAVKPQAAPAPVQVASATPVPADAKTAAAENRFNLVMQQPEIEAPLPMARPEGWPKAPEPAATAKADAPKQQALAYANPTTDNEEIGLPRKSVAPQMQAGVAIYDITARTVYMPDGTRFEAHSGLGQFRDNPKYKTMQGKGPTPPNTYHLSMRESPFHGVPALRMTPQYPDKMFGRGGILTHTYLRRRPGDSAGCIAFKDYYKFLAYFKRGEVHTMIVVESMGDAPKKKSVLASLFGG